MTDLDEEIDRGWFAGELRGTNEVPSVPPAASPDGLSPEAFSRLMKTLEAYEREIKASVDPRRRAAICYEVARLYERALGNEQHAIRFYQRAFGYDPTHLPTLHSGRRVFARAGKWKMVLHLIDAEVRAHPSASHRARLLREKAEIYLVRFGRVTEALHCFQSALEVSPNEAASLRGLASMTALLDQGCGHLPIAVRAARATQDVQIAQAVILDAAGGCLARGEGAEVVSALEDLDQRICTPASQQALAEAYRAAGRWSDYIQCRLRLLESIDNKARGRALIELGTVAEEKLSDLELATTLLERAVEADKEVPAALEMLARLHERMERWGEAANTIARLVRITTDPTSRAARLWCLAELQLEQLNRPDEAVETLRALVELEPGTQPATTVLGRLLGQRGDWSGLLGMYRTELGEMVDPRQKAQQWFRIGEIHEVHLYDVSAAADAYRRAVGCDPAFLYAAKALGRMLLRLGNWSAYVRLLENEVRQYPGADEQIYFYERIAEAYAQNLDRPGDAIAAWRKILVLRPRHLIAVRAIARLCGRTSRWSELLEMNELEMDCVQDETKHLALLVRSAEIAEQRLNDLGRAHGYLRRATSIDPSFLPALQGLGRLCRRRADWPELVAMYQRELTLVNGDQSKIALHYKIGELYRDRLENTEAATQAFESILAIDAQHLPAIRAAGRLHRQSNNMGRVTELLGAEIDLLGEPRERVMRLYELARLHESQREPELAADTLRRALAIEPEFEQALQMLLTIYRQTKDWTALVAIHRDLAEESETPLFHRLAMARIALKNLASPIEAIDAYEAVLALDAENVESMLALERLHLSGGNLVEVVEVLRRLANVATDPVTQIDYLVRRARVNYLFLGDGGAARVDYEAALTLDPSCRESLEWLEVDAADRGDVELFARILEQRLAVSASNKEREMVLQRAGSTLRSAGQLEQAADCFEAVMSLNPDSPIAPHSLRMIYESLGRKDDALRVTEAAGRRIRDPKTASAMLVAAGTSREAEEQGGALLAYVDALMRNPSDEAAATGVRRVCEQSGRWTELVEALETRARNLPERTTELLREVAQLYATRLARPLDAIRVFSGLLTEEPDSTFLLQRLADLFVEQERWDAAAEMYDRLYGSTDDETLKRAVAFRLASLHESKRHRADEAGRWLETILEHTPDDFRAMRRLAMLRGRQGLTKDAVALLKRAASVAKDPVQAAPIRLELARRAVDSGDLEDAAEHYEAVLPTRTADLDLIGEMGELYSHLHRPARIRGIYRRGIEELRAEGVSADTLTRAWKRLIRDSLAAGGEVAELREDAAAAVAHAPEHIAFRRLQARALTHYPDQAEQALSAFRWILERTPFDRPALRAFRKLCEQTGRPDQGYEIARLLVALDAAESDERQAISRWHEVVQRWPARALNEAERDVMRAPEDEADVAVLITAITEGLPSLFTTSAEQTILASDALMERVDRIAALVGATDVAINFDRRELLQSASSGARIILSHSVIQMSQAEQCFVLGAVLEIYRRGLGLFAGADPDHIRIVFSDLAAAAGRPVRDHETSPERVAELRALIGDDDQLFSVLETMADRLPKLDFSRLKTAIWDSAFRVGLLVCGGGLPAISALRRAYGEDGYQPSVEATPGTEMLARWLISDPYYDLRRRLELVPTGSR